MKHIAALLGWIATCLDKGVWRKYSMESEVLKNNDAHHKDSSNENPLPSDDEKGEKNNARLVNASVSLSDDQILSFLHEQQLFANVTDKSLFRTVMKGGEIVEYNEGETIVAQDDLGEYAFFIFSGHVQVYVKEQLVAERGRECVGEMPAFNRLYRRSATLRAKDKVTTFRVPIENIEDIIEKSLDHANGRFLINECRVLIDRLRERSKFCHWPNNKPRIFIGSSSGALCDVKKLNVELTSSGEVQPVPWDGDVFDPSQITIESLEKQSKNCDFAILLMFKDDEVIINGNSSKASVSKPRDNVVFELGLFMGALGRDRVFFLTDDAELPTDLKGVTYLPYQHGHGNKKSLKKAIEKIMAQVRKMKAR